MDSEKEVTANFTPIVPTLTVDVGVGGDGAIEINGAALPSYPDTSPFEYGTPVTLEAVPSPGYIFANWSGDLSSSENPITITMDSNTEIAANFAQTIRTLTVDVSPGDSNIEVDGNAPSSYPATYTFAEGASVNLEAVPASGYYFANWSGDFSESENPITITMDSDQAVTANFTQTAYTLAVSVSPSGGGNIETDGTAPSSYPFTYTFAEGRSVNLEAIPAYSPNFINWSGDLSSSENPTTITMDSNKAVTANFTQIIYTLTVDVSPGDSNIEVDGTAPPLYPATYTFTAGTSVNLEAVPASGYYFANWGGDLSGSENSTTITMDSDKEATANLAQITHTLTVNDSQSDNGTVTIKPPQPAGGYVAGTEVTLTAVASDGYEFDHWNSASFDLKNQITITMDSDKEIAANFIEVSSSAFPWWWIVVGVGVGLIGLLGYFPLSRRSQVKKKRLQKRRSI
jgi:hypothetical protein